jgi:hypothetical protein
MTSLTNGTDPFPTDTQFSGGGYWTHWVSSSYYGNSSSGTDCMWHLVGDDRFFYCGGPIGFHDGSYGSFRQQLYRSCYFFGEFPSYKINDINNIIIQHARGANSNFRGDHSSIFQDEFYFGFDWTGKYIIGRADNQVNSQRNFVLFAPAGYLSNNQSTNSDSIASVYSYGTTLYARNVITGGGIHMAYPTIIGADGVRGYMPGLYFSIQSNRWSDSVVYEDTIYTDKSGRKFFVVPHANGSYEGTFYFLRIDKNWREI